MNRVEQRKQLGIMALSVLLVVWAVVFVSTAKADSTIKIQYGVGFHPDTYITDDIRSVNVGYYPKLEKSVSYGFSAGYLGDKTYDLNAGYACAQFGTSLRPMSFMYVDNYFGPCYFTNAHGAISGLLQFATNIGMGWRDSSTGSEIGLNWKHFSNAGLSRPNRGLDLIMLSLAFGL